LTKNFLTPRRKDAKILQKKKREFVRLVYFVIEKSWIFFLYSFSVFSVFSGKNPGLGLVAAMLL